MFQRVLLAVLAVVVMASPVFAQNLTNLPPASDMQAGDQVAAISEQHKLNLNTATAKELIGVDGINPSRARAIVSYRKKNGDFKSLQDLVNVKGFKRLKPNALQNIKNQLTVE